MGLACDRLAVVSVKFLAKCIEAAMNVGFVAALFVVTGKGGHRTSYGLPVSFLLTGYQVCEYGFWDTILCYTKLICESGLYVL